MLNKRIIGVVFLFFIYAEVVAYADIYSEPIAPPKRKPVFSSYKPISINDDYPTTFFNDTKDPVTGLVAMQLCISGGPVFIDWIEVQSAQYGEKQKINFNNKKFQDEECSGLMYTNDGMDSLSRIIMRAHPFYYDGKDYHGSAGILYGFSDKIQTVKLASVTIPFQNQEKPYFYYTFTKKIPVKEVQLCIRNSEVKINKVELLFESGKASYFSNINLSKVERREPDSCSNMIPVDGTEKDRTIVSALISGWTHADQTRNGEIEFLGYVY